MTPFFIDILLEPLRKRNAIKRREAAERERERIEAEKKHLERLKELRKRGCGHSLDGVVCGFCQRHGSQFVYHHIDSSRMGYW